jgi:WD40 repeat protein
VFRFSSDSYESLGEVQVSSSKVTCFSAGNTGRLLAIGSGNGLIAFYDIKESKLISNDLKYHTMPINTIVFNPDDTKCLSGAHEKDVHLWDTVNLKNLEKFQSKAFFTVDIVRASASVNQLFFENDGFTSFGTDGSIKRWAFN